MDVELSVMSRVSSSIDTAISKSSKGRKVFTSKGSIKPLMYMLMDMHLAYASYMEPHVDPPWMDGEHKPRWVHTREARMGSKAKPNICKSCLLSKKGSDGSRCHIFLH